MRRDKQPKAGQLVLVNGELVLVNGETRRAAWVKWIAVAVMVVIVGAVAVVGELLLREIKQGSPVAAAFTRVGGPTRVETAVDASRFWLTPPPCVVYVQAFRSQKIMFRAARYAMAHDAPLLFTSRAPRRRRLVDTTVDNWQKEPKVFKGSHCPKEEHSADASRVSTPAASKQLFTRPSLPVGAQATLAPVVVFAVDRAPGESPDVAVGLALAAHLAMKYPAVSLVAVPRYLESDYQLEQQLRSQRQLVQGGVILGSAGILTEDTHALLRQILISTDQQSVYSQIQTSLGLLGSIAATLLPLFVGAGAAAVVLLVVAPVLIPPLVRAAQPAGSPPTITGTSATTTTPPTTKTPQPRRLLQKLGSWWKRMASRRGRNITVIEAPPQEESDWLKVLGDDQAKQVTVWLRSGWTVSGTIAKSTVKVFRINGAHLVQGPPAPTFKLDPKLSVLVAAEDIIQITLTT